MTKKIISLLLVLVIAITFVTGCDSKKENDSDTANSNKIDSVDDLASDSGTLNCTRLATVEGGSGTFNYIVSYKGDDLTHLSSSESVKSNDQSILDTYEDSYKKIDSYYEGIKYYDTEIIRDNDSVTYNIDIDYEKVDVKKIIELEGEEDNIFENNKAKLSKYLEFSKKLGITCSESSL